jgi:hypothetical protein
MDLEGKGSSRPGRVEKSNSGRESPSKEGFREMVDSSLKDRFSPRGSSVTLNFTYYTYKSITGAMLGR